MFESILRSYLFIFLDEGTRQAYMQYQKEDDISENSYLNVNYYLINCQWYDDELSDCLSNPAKKMSWHASWITWESVYIVEKFLITSIYTV